ncbi:MAG TPA: malto-oligosyltrehalose trehalohydrolase [Rhizomicrobium sp.]
MKFRFGPCVRADGTTFRLWAPAAREVLLQVEGLPDIRMTARDNGWHEAEAPGGAGARYRFHVGGSAVPDPASRMQADDVHGASVVTDPHAYEWQCTGWKGLPWEEAVLYELHPGLLGGFVGVQKHLTRLAELGITAVELMPIADFPGERNWGYDGALPFAPDRAYGTPDELKALIDAAHGRGMMVFLDVVYNHFGPDGNYLGLYAPQFFDESKHTPWGAAINFAEPEVRRFFIENALYWLTEFRFDGLRFDAVHAIPDKSFLGELAHEIRATFPSERHVHLVVENDDNDSSLLRAGFDAQWDDDFHHVLHVLLTDETKGYYEDYKDEPAGKLARALSDGFVYQGDPSPFRGGAPRGSRTEGLKPTAFVSFLQNHDQIGNRAFGERLLVLTNPEKLKAAIALQLLAPQIPLIFMGEEVGACERFLYFTDYSDPKLAQAVRDGRRQEFAKFPEFADQKKRAQIPDPNAPETFDQCRLRFADNSWRTLYSRLLRLRRERLFSRLKGIVSEGAEAIGPKAARATWRFGDGARLVIACNLGDESITTQLPEATPIWGETPDGTLPPATTLVWIE